MTDSTRVFSPDIPEITSQKLTVLSSLNGTRSHTELNVVILILVCISLPNRP